MDIKTNKKKRKFDDTETKGLVIKSILKNSEGYDKSNAVDDNNSSIDVKKVKVDELELKEDCPKSIMHRSDESDRLE